ncbi:MAG: CBS domain-containing protein, partial [Vulcanimicrobiota bacterium]
RIYMVARSIRQAIDVSRITSFFNGGGHTTAASAVIKNMNLEKVEKLLKKVLKRFIRPHTKAEDIMSSPVLTLELEEDMTIQDAFEQMHRYGHYHLPILKEGKLVGIIDRHDVDKASNHGYLNAPLRVYMSKPVTTYPEASIFQIQNLMMKKGYGCIPVIDKGKVAGIITRTDVLEAIYKRDLENYRKQRRAVDQIKKLPAYLRDILKTCGRVADKMKVNIYVVGGFVRDLLLGVENLDIDLVVEGDGMKYGDKLAQKMGGRAKAHEKFGTSVVVLPSNMHIDIATSRTEYYTRPAALPEVTRSSIKQDLYRRDFTINAMAIRLNQKFFGELLDFFGCRRDLKNGVVRVLHPLSFIDDPTRILRAVKFEQRYQFTMDQFTENQLKEALYQDIFQHVSAERIRNELIEILEEARPLPALKRMDQLHILRIIHSDLSLDSRHIDALESAQAVLLQFKEIAARHRIKQWVIYLSVLLMNFEFDEIKKIAKKMRIPLEVINQVSFKSEKINKMVRILCSRNLPTSELYGTLHGISLESLFFLLAKTKIPTVRTRIVNYINKLLPQTPLISGYDLQKWGVEPGPVYKKLLSLLFDAQLDKLFTTKEGAEEFFETRLKSLVEKEDR